MFKHRGLKLSRCLLSLEYLGQNVQGDLGYLYSRTTSCSIFAYWHYPMVAPGLFKLLPPSLLPFMVQKTKKLKMYSFLGMQELFTLVVNVEGPTTCRNLEVVSG